MRSSAGVTRIFSWDFRFDESVNILGTGHDIGIRFGDRVEPGMVARQVTAPMQEALFASDAYLERHGEPASLEDLRQHKLIQYRFIASNQLAPLLLLNDGQTTTVNMPVALVVNDTDAMVDAAEKGLGIGRIVTPMVAEHFASGRLRPVLQPHWYPYSGLFLYFVRNSQKARRVRALIDFWSKRSSAARRLKRQALKEACPARPMTYSAACRISRLTTGVRSPVSDSATMP
ncbi:LysR substrate-binding domain-containing protein [Oceanimonas sp. NS1]|nr:LysR substrate-binding domain-containing protein [Oceanimonas sp. NS1]